MTRYANMAFGSEKASKPYIAYAACMPRSTTAWFTIKDKDGQNMKQGYPK
jgi:hypothetical protein